MIKIKKKFYSSYGVRSWSQSYYKPQRRIGTIKNIFSNVCCAHHFYDFRTSWNFIRYPRISKYIYWTERRIGKK